MDHRPERVSSLIQAELGKLLLREVEFDGALVTITDVEVGKKLEIAIVLVSVIPSEKSEGVLRVLDKAQPHLQYLLLRILNIKPMPKIKFKIDHGPERAAEVEKLLLNK